MNKAKILRHIVVLTLVISMTLSANRNIPVFASVENNSLEIDEGKPVLTVEEGTYYLDLKQKLFVDGLAISIVAKNKCNISFSDGTVEKSYSKYGTYILTIVVTDTVTGLSSSDKIMVVVKDMKAPTLSGIKNLTVVKGSRVNLMKGVTAKDNIDGDLKYEIKVKDVELKEIQEKGTWHMEGGGSSPDDEGIPFNNAYVYFNKAGTYEYTYSVKDSSNNESSKVIKVTVKDAKFTKQNKSMYVIAYSTVIRSDYSSYSDKVKVINFRSKLTVVGSSTNTSWVKVKLSNGKIAYCNANYLSEKKPATLSSKGKKIGDKCGLATIVDIVYGKDGSVLYQYDKPEAIIDIDAK